MISAVVVIGSSWVAITTAGQSGAVFAPNVASYIGNNTVLVAHGATPPVADTDDYFQLRACVSNFDNLSIVPDSTTDIYYVRCAGSLGSATIIVDVV